jgi:hypothetical protein
LTASEAAFLIFGLVLGVASGAALIEVLRARPPASRHIRVTVAPNAIQGRLAATLSEPPTAPDVHGPAAGGPGDRRLAEDPTQEPGIASEGRRLDDRRAPGMAGETAPDRTAVPSASSPPGASQPIAIDVGADRPSPLWLRSAVDEAEPRSVGVPISIEPDPITTALRATAAKSAVAAMSGGRTGRAVAVSEAAGADGSESGGNAGDGRPLDRPPRATGTDEPAAPAPDGACAEERRVAEERCAVATRAREGATAAAAELRRQQRAYDDLVDRAEAAAATADPRSVRAAKEQAQQRFRAARATAATRDDVEAGAREWLAEINRINQDTREATTAAERDRAAAAQLGPMLERLSVEADAARITAERAEEACVAAREAVAACDEENRLAAAAAAAPTREPAAGATDEAAPRIAAAMPEPEDEFEFSTPMRSSGGGDAPILRILRGDREAFDRAVARLAGDDDEARRRWQARLGGLADALVARSIEAAAFDFPVDHPFWGPFNQSQNRDIAAGLASLGYRFDGYGGWLDERVPTQRDLSLAVGYAGLDPMRIRHWPTEGEMRDLLADVRVAADEYVAGAAGGMSLGELVTLLGRRADPLAELWNEWGTVRPILLEVD